MLGADVSTRLLHIFIRDAVSTWHLHLKLTYASAQSWEIIRADAQNQVNVGAIFQGSSPQNFYPVGITLNGQRCFIQQLR